MYYYVCILHKLYKDDLMEILKTDPLIHDCVEGSGLNGCMETELFIKKAYFKSTSVQFTFY